MLKHSPRLVHLCEGKLAALHPATLQTADLQASAARQPLYNPTSPVGYRAEVLEVAGRASADRFEGSLGKRSASRYYAQQDSGRQAAGGSATKSRLERLQEIEQRYRAISEKLSATKKENVFETPKKGKEEPARSSAARLSEEFASAFGCTPVKVLGAQDENRFETPKRQQELSKEKQQVAEAEVISISVDAESLSGGRQLPVAQTSSKRFLVDAQTRLSYRAYAARTNNGLLRKYNEDRVSIIQKIFLDNDQSHPTSFFALFDGHSGVKCADYLRDHLHQFITRKPAFRRDKPRALAEGILECEARFAELARKAADNSGSCALVCLFEQEKLFVANVGDSRALMSRGRGAQVQQLTVDHKPDEPAERERIFQHGGSIFRSKKCSFRETTRSDGVVTEPVEGPRYGPFRVEPGGLSVSRTIGDLFAKDASRCGNPHCIVARPDVFDFEIASDSDFVILACDGVFDVLDNREVTAGVWDHLRKYAKQLGLKEACRLAAENVMKLSFDKKSMDNVTVIVIAFQEEEYYH